MKGWISVWVINELNNEEQLVKNDLFVKLYIRFRRCYFIMLYIIPYYALLEIYVYVCLLCSFLAYLSEVARSENFWFNNFNVKN